MNTGFGANGALAGLPLQRQLEMIQVNITALTHLTALFLPDMIERRRGVCSTPVRWPDYSTAQRNKPDALAIC